VGKGGFGEEHAPVGEYSEGVPRKGMVASEDEDSATNEDAETVAFADEAIAECEGVVTVPSGGEDSVVFDTEIEVSGEASETYKVNAEPDEDEDIPYKDVDPCAEIAACDEETVASVGKENAASEDTETEQPEEADAEPSEEHVEPELELEAVPQFEVTETPAVIPELVVEKLGVIENSAKFETLLKFLAWLAESSLAESSWKSHAVRIVEGRLVRSLQTYPLSESPRKLHHPQLTQWLYHSCLKRPLWLLDHLHIEHGSSR